MPAYLDRLTSLLGASLDDSKLVAFLAEGELAPPKPTTDSTDSRTVTDKTRGIELYFTHAIASRKFYPPKKTGKAYVTYLERILIADDFKDPLPLGVTRTMGRPELVATLGEPSRTPIGDEVYEKEIAPGAMLNIGRHPEKGIRNIWLTVPQGFELDVDALHFEAMPPEGKPAHADHLATGMLLAWAADRVGLAPHLATTEKAKALAKREITGRELLISELGSSLLSEDLDPRLEDFLYFYTHRLFDVPDEARRAKDEVAYTDDYLATFKKVIKNPYLVPDSWEAFDRLAPILDARWADYQQTKFLTPAPKGLYEAANKKREAQTIKVDTTPTAKATVAGGTTEKLMAIVGRSTSEPEVKSVLTALGLPVGTTIDQQAVPKLGVSYMAVRLPKSRMPAGLPQKAVVIIDVRFNAKGNKEYVRGAGSDVIYAQYPGPLPQGLTFGDDREAVHKRIGKPTRSSEEIDHWNIGERELTVWYTKKGNAVKEVVWAMPRGFDDDDE
ncbi:MAG: hypothetical protein JWP01_1005 [Myxococcales bacterium]|nr:hypothetical protein [Myxococcales bacterium]